jgi:hypothetical protein
MMTDNQEALRLQLEAITLEHRDLDDVISELSQNPFVNQLQLTRLKKRKLYLKDQIERIKSKLIPDLNA